MRRALLPLLLAALAAAGLWLALPTLAPGLPPLSHGLLAGGLFLLLAAGLAALRRERALVALGGEMAELRRRVHDAEEEVLWARRELKSLVEALRAHAAARTPEPERAVTEAQAEVRLLKSVVTQLDGTAAAATATAQPSPAPNHGHGHDHAAGRPAAGDGVARIPAQAALTAVREALKEDRIELVLQPIVSLPQRRRRFYECFSRLRDAEGRRLLPEAYIAVAERAGLMAAIDNMLLLRCIQLVRRIQRKGERVGFVCNLSPHTLKDAEFFGDFVDYLDANAELATSLVFEMTQADFAALAPEAEDYLVRLWHLGARLSLDSVRDLELDPGALAARHVDFVKVPAAALLTEPPERVTRLRRRLAQAEIDLVAEKIESDEQLVELLELGIDYGQGYLFGEPRPARQAA